MARRGEQNIFSTSFIDMICVALCSQIILWIVAADDPLPPPAQKRIRYFELTQFGQDHLFPEASINHEPGNQHGNPRHIRLYRPGKYVGPKDFLAKSKAWVEKPENQIPGVTLQPLFKPDPSPSPSPSPAGPSPSSPVSPSPSPSSGVKEEDFAGGLRIVAPEGCEEFTLEVPIDGCQAYSELHYIRCAISFLGREADSTYFLCEQTHFAGRRVKWDGAAGSSALLPGKAGEFARGVVAMPKDTGMLQIHVPRRGKISVKCLGEDPHDTEELHKRLRLFYPS